jgi:hypothetical protein
MNTAQWYRMQPPEVQWEIRRSIDRLRVHCQCRGGCTRLLPCHYDGHNTIKPICKECKRKRKK